MLRTIVYVGFGCVIAWSVIYPFWTSSDAPVGSVSTDNKDSAASVDNISNQANDKIANSNSSSFLDIFAMPHGAATEDILTAGIDPFAPEFTDDYPIPDFASFTDVKAKKTAFFDFIRHFAEQNNAILLQKRAFILALEKQAANVDSAELLFTSFTDSHLNERDQEKVAFLTSEYRVKEINTDDVIARLLLRVHTVPVELVQVQTANESGWGTSRFATQGYNYFGLWCYNKGCGFVPSRRNDGASHEVAKFSSPAEGMYQYIRNLNRNRAYRDLRTIRAELLDDPDMIQDSYARAMALTRTLGAYSERGDEYIDELQAMLRVNKPFLNDSENREK
jgi:Bax protein